LLMSNMQAILDLFEATKHSTMPNFTACFLYLLTKKPGERRYVG